MRLMMKFAWKVLRDEFCGSIDGDLRFDEIVEGLSAKFARYKQNKILLISLGSNP